MKTCGKMLQPALLIAAGLLLGAALGGAIDRRYLRLGAAAGFLGVVPFGGLNPAIALFIVTALTAITWTSIKVLRRAATRLAD